MDHDKHGNIYGIAFANGKRWVEQRRFFSKYLAGSKQSFDAIIADQVFHLCEKVNMNGFLNLTTVFSGQTTR